MQWRNSSNDCADTNPDYMEVKLLRLIQTDTHSEHIRFESSTRTDISADVASVFLLVSPRKCQSRMLPPTSHSIPNLN
jgi:hypothetical protein